jgi:hypothetical protein
MKKLARQINVAILSGFVFSVLLAFLMAQPLLAVAQETWTGTPVGTGSSNCADGKLCNPIGSSSLADFLQKIADAVLKVGIPIASVFIIFAGLKFVMAAGDTKAIEDAKRIFWYTIIGTAILLGATLLAKVLLTTITQIAG